MKTGKYMFFQKDLWGCNLISESDFISLRDKEEEKQYSFCFKCGYAWISKSKVRSKRCPRCRSSRWDVPDLKGRSCKFCGHIWQMKNPNEPCPECGKKQMESFTDKTLHCNQCDHEWVRRLVKLPKKCPLCHSADWNKPKYQRLMCQQCGYLWKNQTGRPYKCPSCQSKVWDQPLRVVKCQRCGHVWKMRSTRLLETSSICPKCKSRKWNEAPIITCGVQGTYSLKQNSSIKTSNRKAELMSCRSCGNRWYAGIDGKKVCPRCGSKISLYDKMASTSMSLWKRDRFELTYVSENGYGCVYLWDDDIPIVCRYMNEVFTRFSMNIGQIIEAVNNKSMDNEWKELSEEMYADREGYTKYIDYFMKRLSLEKHDARILAMHFTGMAPEAIAKKFHYDEVDVFFAFERIMKAYSDSGIVVDDTIFTEDPFKYY